MSSRGGRGHHHQKKRNKPYNNANEKENVNIDSQSPIAKTFQSYQTELDAKYDKYERLVKKSRDLTIESKRIIFLLHRATSDENKEDILKEAETRLNAVLADVVSGISSELSKQEVYQFLRSFSPGLQEYVEAASFYHYLKNGTLASMNDIQCPQFSNEQPESHELEAEKSSEDLSLSRILTPIDFILGIADLTGELMRKCINSVAAGNMDEPFVLCALLQNIYNAFLVNNCHPVRELSRKVNVLKSSLQKVENACYAIKIRGTEVPKHVLADFFSNEEFPGNIDCDI